MISLILSLFLVIGFLDQSPQTLILEVSVYQAKSDLGQIRILVFSSEKGFPDQPSEAVKSFSLTPKEKSCKIRIEGLTQGKYAVSVIHDEDEDGILTTNLVGYPTEKFGFSNNPKVYFAPPSFDKAAFELNAKTKQVRINLR